MTLLAVDQVAKRFGGLPAVDGVTFGVDKGEILATGHERVPGAAVPEGKGATLLVAEQQVPLALSLAGRRSWRRRPGCWRGWP
jgi:ABC-type branched-subunit amino acid transport system ATPase component